jgi:hypothetical protein
MRPIIGRVFIAFNGPSVAVLTVVRNGWVFYVEAF